MMPKRQNSVHSERSLRSQKPLPSTQERAQVRFITVDSESDGQRIDNFLMRHLRGVPKSRIYRLLRHGEVRVDGARSKPERRLIAGQKIRIPPIQLEPERETNHTIPEGLRQLLAESVLFEDERLLVINKPAGLAVHGGSGLSFGMIEILRSLYPKNELELAHRLDRETSGCLLVSKRRSALRRLHEMLRENEVNKRYLCLLCGTLPKRKTLVDVPLRKNSLRGGERMVIVDTAEGKPAKTIFSQIETFHYQGQAYTLAEATLLTGRTNQIRVHAAYLKAPLAGDPKYGDAQHNQTLKKLGLTRMFLHAAQLELPSLTEEKRMQFRAPLPADLNDFVFQLRQATVLARDDQA